MKKPLFNVERVSKLVQLYFILKDGTACIKWNPLNFTQKVTHVTRKTEGGGLEADKRKQLLIKKNN